MIASMERPQGLEAFVLRKRRNVAHDAVRDGQGCRDRCTPQDDGWCGAPAKCAAHQQAWHRFLTSSPVERPRCATVIARYDWSARGRFEVEALRAVMPMGCLP